MAVNYIMREMPDVRGIGKRVLYPKMVHTRCMGNNEFLDLAAESSSLSRGDIEAALHAVAKKMKEFMALGYSVKIDELGTFCAQLRLGSGKERETLDETEANRNAQSIIVGNVGYIPARKFLSNIHCACRLERDGAVRELKKSPYSADERISLALKFLDVHPFMTASDYASITRLSYPSAIRELHKLRTDPASGIRTMGRAPHLVYVRKE